MTYVYASLLVNESMRRKKKKVDAWGSWITGMPRATGEVGDRPTFRLGLSVVVGSMCS